MCEQLFGFTQKPIFIKGVPNKTNEQGITELTGYILWFVFWVETKTFYKIDIWSMVNNFPSICTLNTQIHY